MMISLSHPHHPQHHHRRQPNLQSYYYRKRQFQFHRQAQEVKWSILNRLMEHGPTSITRICYIVQISHGQAKRYLADLIELGFIQAIHVKDLHLNRRKGAFPKEIRDVGLLNPNVNKALMLTALGRKYVNKCNRLEAMIQWQQ